MALRTDPWSWVKDVESLIRSPSSVRPLHHFLSNRALIQCARPINSTLNRVLCTPYRPLSVAERHHGVCIHMIGLGTPMVFDASTRQGFRQRRHYVTLCHYGHRCARPCRARKGIIGGTPLCHGFFDLGMRFLGTGTACNIIMSVFTTDAVPP